MARDYLKALQPEDRILGAHICDKIDITFRQNIMTHTSFLSPHERQVASKVISWNQYPRHCFLGGSEGAERALLLFLPDYMEELPPAEDWPIAALRVQWGRNNLTHRDVLGSLMALGVKREVLGDILIREDGADVFCLKETCLYLHENWLSVGKIGISPMMISVDEVLPPSERAEKIQDTVPSLRLDAIVSSGLRLSREKAKALILSGKVFLNGCEVCSPDKLLEEGDFVSVRGFGRLRLTELKGESKKGRMRIEMERLT